MHGWFFSECSSVVFNKILKTGDDFFPFLSGIISHFSITSKAVSSPVKNVAFKFSKAVTYLLI